MKKKFIVAFITLVCLGVGAGVITQAETYAGSCGDSATYTLDTETGVLMITGTGEISSYTSINTAPWYTNVNDIRSVVIENGVTSIGNYAFYHCSNLTSITIPDSVKTIETSSFYGCNGLTDVYYQGELYDWLGITFDFYWSNPVYYANNIYINGELLSGEIVIPFGITSIGESAFAGFKSLTKVTIPDGVQSIGPRAFLNCSGIENVVIDNSVQNIGQGAFYGCDNLKNITLPFVGGQQGLNQGEASVFGYIFGRSTSGGSAYTQQYFKSGYSYDSLYYKIPETLVSVTITGEGAIPYGAFYNCDNIRWVIIGEGITSIGNKAFYNCTGLIDAEYNGNKDNLQIGSDNTCLINKIRYKKGMLGSNCKWSLDYSTGNLAITGSGEIVSDTPWLSNCDYIKSIIIGDGITGISENLFRGCDNLKKITIPSSVTKIDVGAFIGCEKITEVYYEGELNNWFEITFGNYDSNPMYYADILYVDGKAVKFEGEFVIPDGVIHIGNYTFYNCSKLTNVIIPDSVTSIEEYAFSSCNGLTSVTIPDNVINIGGYAFYKCNNLTSVVIGERVALIEKYAFYENGSLTDAVYLGNKENLNIYGCNTPLTNVIRYTKGSCGTNCSWTLNYETGTLTISGKGDMKGYTYPSDAPWYSNKSYIKSIVIEEGVTRIGSSSFGSCNNLTSVTIPQSVTSAGSSAFRGCSELNDVYYEGELTDWLEIDFYNSSATPMCCAENLYINGNLLEGEIVIPDGVTSIADYALSDCNGVTSVIFPDSVTSIGIGSLSGCDCLTSVILPDSVISIGEGAFTACSKLTDITIPKNVTYIEDYMFSGCSSLTSIIMPDGVTSIGEEAFYDCSKLTSITIPDSVTNIEECAFKETGYYNNTENWEDGVLYIGKCLIEAKSDVSGNLTIKEDTKLVADNAFEDCESLTCVVYNGSESELIVGTNNDSLANVIVYTEGACGEALTYSFDVETGTLKIKGSGAMSDYTADSTAQWYAFGDKVTSIELGKNVTYIGDYAFYNCSEVSEITIPKAVTSIGDYAFEGCDGLKRVYYEGTEDEWIDLDISRDGNDDIILYAKLYYNTAIEEDEEPDIIATINNNTLTIVPNNIAKGNIVSALTIKDGVAKTYVCEYTGSGNVTFTLDEGIDSVKVFAWKSYTSMEPIVEAVTVK